MGDSGRLGNPWQWSSESFSDAEIGAEEYPRSLCDNQYCVDLTGVMGNEVTDTHAEKLGLGGPRSLVETFGGDPGRQHVYYLHTEQGRDVYTEARIPELEAYSS